MARISADSEWRLGWRIVSACAIANATGISLLFYSYSLFIKPMEADFGLTRGEAGVVQSLVILAALGAPIIGRLVDRTGFHGMFLACTLAMAAVEVGLARWGNGFAAMALGNAAIGFIGGGSSTVLLTRPISAHFRRWRGFAFGCVGVGISLTTLFVPRWLEGVIASAGWRQGYYMLALIALVIGLPLVLALMPRTAALQGDAAAAPAAAPAAGPIDRAFLRSRDFWLITAAAVLANLATSGVIGQLSPMLQESGLAPRQAAWGITTFALGQFIGKLGGGWLLDRHDPRIVAAAITVAATGAFVLLLGAGAALGLLLCATGLLGLLQGADISIFSYFIARRFPISQYGTVFGTMHGIGWIGTAASLIGYGASFGYAHGYWLAQSVAIVLLLACAGVILMIRLPAAAATD